MRLTAGHGEEGLDVLDLALHGVRQRISAGTATAARIVVDAEALRELARERLVFRAIIEAPGDQDDARPGSNGLVRDGRSVFRGHPALRSKRSTCRYAHDLVSFFRRRCAFTACFLLSASASRCRAWARAAARSERRNSRSSVVRAMIMPPTQRLRITRAFALAAGSCSANAPRNTASIPRTRKV